MDKPLTCFMAYDIRGRVPDEINEDIAYRIGRSFARFVQANKVVVGRDVRHSGESLSKARMGTHRGANGQLFRGG